jgi:hypothetical protein
MKKSAGFNFKRFAAGLIKEVFFVKLIGAS